jgi:hypothetical protein
MKLPRTPLDPLARPVEMFLGVNRQALSATRKKQPQPPARASNDAENQTRAPAGQHRIRKITFAGPQLHRPLKKAKRKRRSSSPGSFNH